ncbi:ACP S-malonyltransferase [Streptomyces sp. AJS327]|uniref:ACP S-malonyltransferase n=1 Tax=Streptomyces sp. AJS327 TaxID=2545265 RepID=UPI001C60B499|nr:ACP S-malonyltransferase [Streptomyces sp. AJS327]
MTTTYVFPGQGSHRVGMGEAAFGRYPHLVRQADSVLGYSVADLCLSGPAERLGDTRYTQPALYVAGSLAYLERVRETGIVPSLLAGHSLGEYVALFAAGAFDFLTGLELVAERARLMAEAGDGGMCAVIGLDAGRVTELLADVAPEGVTVANLNAPRQVVLSGPRGLHDTLRGPLVDGGARSVVSLPVSGAFHSPHMRPAAERFGAFLRSYRFNDLKIPVLSNVTARPHEDASLGELLTRQLVEPVRWTECVGYALDQPGGDVVEVGPGRVLTGLLRQLRESRAEAAA